MIGSLPACRERRPPAARRSRPECGIGLFLVGHAGGEQGTAGTGAHVAGRIGCRDPADAGLDVLSTEPYNDFVITIPLQAGARNDLDG